MVTAKDIVLHELVGLEVRVISSANKQLEGLSGTVIDETRNMLTIETQKGEKKLSKQDCTFSFPIPSGQWVKVRGDLLLARPEDRIKKRLRKW